MGVGWEGSVVSLGFYLLSSEHHASGTEGWRRVRTLSSHGEMEPLVSHNLECSHRSEVTQQYVHVGREA